MHTYGQWTELRVGRNGIFGMDLRRQTSFWTPETKAYYFASMYAKGERHVQKVSVHMYIKSNTSLNSS